LRRRHPTLKGLMIAVAAIGVGIAVLVRPNKLWSLFLPLLLLTMYLMSILGVLFRRGSGRAYWAGFAIFGWAYFILIFLLSGEQGFANSPVSLPNLLAERILGVFELLMIPGVIGSEMTWAEIGDHLRELAGEADDASRFVIAFSLLGLIFAAIGGMIARVFSDKETAATDQAQASDVASRGGA
jgi:hypothetical protein